MVKNNKKNQPVTFELLTEFYSEFLKPQFEGLKKLILKNGEEIRAVKVELGHVKNEVVGIKAEV